jgi:SAM-dependent methyltransferase
VALDEVVGAFDQISSVYDETRHPLDPATLDSIAEHLRGANVTNVLEVGVGTGRIAVPLRDRGFEITGVDASRKMLAVARSKHLPRLIRGDAFRLPFADGTFDSAIFVHVLHLLDDSPTALGEAVRVSRRGARALVHPPRDRHDEANGRRGLETDRIVFRYLAEEGYPLPEPMGGPRRRERKILSQFPPDELVVVSDREITEPLARRLEMIEKRASRSTLSVPPDVLQRAAAAARAEIGDRTITYRRVEALATWHRVPLASSSSPSEGSEATTRRNGDA